MAHLRREVLYLLRTTSLAPIADDLKRLAQVKAAGPRLAAVMALATNSDYSMLPNAEPEMLGPMPDTAEQQPRSLASMVRLKPDSPKALVALMARWMASTPDVDIRRGVASALRDARSAVAGCPATTGLDDADQMVRYYSVVGVMATFADAGPSAPFLRRSSTNATSTAIATPWLAWREAHRAEIATAAVAGARSPIRHAQKS